jgi:hypothetical protein
MFNSNSPTPSQTPDLPPENEQVDIDFDDIQDRVDDEQEEEQPAPLHRERLPTILEDPEEEEEEEVEEQPAPLRHERLPTILEDPEEEEEPIQEAATVDCKDQELRDEWFRVFCAIPTVSTPPAPAPAEKVEEVFEKEHVEVKDPIIGMWICFQPTAAQVTVAVSRKFVVYISFHTCNFHLTLVYCQFQLSNFLTDSRSTT